MKEESIRLHSTEGGADKLYEIVLTQRDGGWVVNFAYGRRGSTLRPGCKTPAPLGYEAARKVYDKVLAGQLKDGYRVVGESGGGHVSTEFTERDSGLRPQLLADVVDDAERERLLDSAFHACQQKLDGERRLIVCDGEQVLGVNKKGLFIALASEIDARIRAQLRWRGRTVLDGEDLGDGGFVAFDLLELDGEDLRPLPYADRLARLQHLLADAEGVTCVATHTDPAAKRRLREQLRTQGFEGVVYKDLRAPWYAGKIERGGAAIKDKFTESATCRVIGTNPGKRSISVELLDPETALWVCVGSCTVPANHAIPEAGALVEISYLYALASSRVLYQPVYRGPRDDQSHSDAVITQLKFRAEDAIAAAA